MTTKEILLGASRRLREKGWCQGSYGRTAFDFIGRKSTVPAGAPCRADRRWAGVAQTCIVGALRQVGGDDSNVEKAMAKLRKVLAVANLSDWNDEDGRTVEDVCQALELAAA